MNKRFPALSKLVIMFCRFIVFVTTLFSLLYINIGFAQQTFDILIGGNEDEFVFNFILDTDNNSVGIVLKRDIETNVQRSYLYKINNEFGDTISKLVTKPDTILILRDIIRSGDSAIEYLVTGTGYNIDSSSFFWFSYFAKVNNNLDIIWEKIYQLHQVHNYGTIPFYPNLLKLKDGGYLNACFLTSSRKMYLFELSEEGDSVAYRMYSDDSTGSVQDLTYNYDSTAYWLHTRFAHYDPLGPESQCIVVDFNLQQTKVLYYPRWFSEHLSAKLLPDGNLVSGSKSSIPFYDPPNSYSMNFLMAYKLDTGFRVLDSCYITNPRSKNRTGFCALDYYSPDNIYLVGEDSTSLSTFPNYYNHIAIARMDQNLNLISEKYFGGDAHYAGPSVVACSDGGMLLTCTRYDYLMQDEDRDIYIVKLDSSYFPVGNTEIEIGNLHNAILYPNPGNEVINIRTSLKETCFELYNLNGIVVLRESINNLITTLNTENLLPGMYTWQIKDNNIVYETGKWIKK